MLQDCRLVGRDAMLRVAVCVDRFTVTLPQDFLPIQRLGNDGTSFAGLVKQLINRAGHESGPGGDEVYTPSPRRSVAQRGNLNSLSEPRCQQNLCANPKRTAKFQRPDPVPIPISDQKSLKSPSSGISLKRYPAVALAARLCPLPFP